MLIANKQAILFDLDGTLLDTANDLGETLNYILTSHNMPSVKREDYRPIASDGALGLLTLGFGKELPAFNYEHLREEFLTYYQNNIAVHTTYYAGIESLINHLNTKQIPWGIVTNKPIGLTEILLKSFPLLQTSHVTLGGDSLPQRKPHPAPLLKALESLNTTQDNCIYLGDAPRDITAANSANMLSVIAKWGYIENVDACNSWQADKMVSNPLQLIVD